jgi:hypothetical protein
MNFWPKKLIKFIILFLISIIKPMNFFHPKMNWFMFVWLNTKDGGASSSTPEWCYNGRVPSEILFIYAKFQDERLFPNVRMDYAHLFNNYLFIYLKLFKNYILPSIWCICEKLLNSHTNTPFRASPMVLSMWSCTLKMDEENPNLNRFDSGNWFWLSNN